MAKRCMLTGAGPLTGNRVSHSGRTSRARALPNLQWRRVWSPAKGRFVRILLSMRALRSIDKRGADAVLADRS